MKEKQQNKRKKRILLAILMLVVTGIALSTATYAWFSANTIVTATDINIKVTAATGISISADALNFGKTVSYASIQKFANDNKDAEATSEYAPSLQVPELLNPVSTKGITGAETKFSFYQGELGDNDVVVLPKASTDSHYENIATTEGQYYTSGDFMAFNLYIMSSVEQEIKLNANTTITALGTTTGNLESALRIGFLPLGTSDDSSSSSAQSKALKLNTVGTDWKIYNPYPYLDHAASLVAYGDGESEAANGYYALSGLTDSNTTNNLYDKDGVLKTAEGTYIKYMYKDVKADGEDSAKYQTLLDTNNEHYIQGASDANILPAGSLVKLGAGITKVRVYIWLEGNDKDCVDAISISDGLKINLGFEVVKKTS